MFKSENIYIDQIIFTLLLQHKYSQKWRVEETIIPSELLIV